MNIQPDRHAVSGLSLIHWLRCLFGALLLVAFGSSHGAPTAEGLIESSVLTASPTAKAASAATLEAAETVVIFNREIVVFRSSLLGVTAEDRARRTRANLERLLDRAGEGKLTVQSESLGNLVMLDGTLAVIVTRGDVDALQGQTLAQLTAAVTERLHLVIEETRESRDLSSLLRAVFKAAVALLVFVLGLWLLSRAIRYAQLMSLRMVDRRANRLRLAGAQLIRRDQLVAGVRLGMLALHWTLGLALANEWLSFSLRVFPYTRAWGEQLHGYMMGVLVHIGSATLQAIPNLAVAVCIFLIARAVIAMLRPVFDNIEGGRGSAGWLDRDTVVPTRRIASALIWIFALVMAYPYLPGADTAAFKGMSVLLGLMISLGSSSVVGQGASGLILMYSRSVRRGEYVRIGEQEGTVTEVGLFMTKIRTGLGEEVCLPNAMILGSPTKNYSRAVLGEGYIVDTTVSIGYDTPWRQVDAMLIEAARRTDGILTTPRPQVFQTSLSDFYPVYRLVCQAVPEMPRVRAEVLDALHGNIQDVFNEHGVQIMSPHYMMDPATHKVVPPNQWFTPPAKQDVVGGPSPRPADHVQPHPSN
jgi:small-conductance mechanosensitive channel